MLGLGSPSRLRGGSSCRPLAETPPDVRLCHRIVGHFNSVCSFMELDGGGQDHGRNGTKSESMENWNYEVKFQRLDYVARFTKKGINGRPLKCDVSRSG